MRCNFTAQVFKWIHDCLFSAGVYFKSCGEKNLWSNFFFKNENLTFWHSNQVLSAGKNTAPCYLTNTWLNMFCFQEATERNLMYEQPLRLMMLVWWVKSLFFRRNFTSIKFFSALKNRDFKTKPFKGLRSFLKLSWNT